VEFREYFVYVRSLGFEDCPDYRYTTYNLECTVHDSHRTVVIVSHLRRRFKDLFEQRGFEDDGLFYWDELKVC
jgi:hypothetical protein